MKAHPDATLKKYSLRCPGCGTKFPDDGYRLHCDRCQAEDRKTVLDFSPAYHPQINRKTQGLDRYDDFLPGGPIAHLRQFTTTVKSKGFSAKYGLENLYFTLTGYHPNLGIDSPTCSFKELEAISVFHRLRSFGISKPLLVASAGNTGRAIAYYAAKYSYPTIIVAPSSSRQFFWLPDDADGLYEKASHAVRVLFIESGNYRDASLLAGLISARAPAEILNEGGYLNIGRTCGLSTCALNFYDTLGAYPDHYIQAVGSASGPLAVLRAYRLLQDNPMPKIRFHLVQNTPFTPLVDAIERQGEFAVADYVEHMDTACSPMLTSANPVYDIGGGLRDAMRLGVRFHGYGVTNEEIYQMQHEFWRLEKIQVLLPAAAALAGLVKILRAGRVPSGDLIQVNVTGCGDIAKRHESGFFYLPAFTDTSIPKSICYSEAEFTDWFHSVRDRLFNRILG